MVFKCLCIGEFFKKVILRYLQNEKTLDKVPAI